VARALPELERRLEPGLTVSLSVVIPSYNSADVLNLTLQALYMQLHGDRVEAEVVVVDDGSTDHTRSVATQYEDRPDFTYVYRARDARSSRARARNLGSSRATRSTLLFLDAGVLPGPGLLARIVSAARAKPSIAVCRILGAFTSTTRKVTVENYVQLLARNSEHPQWQDVREPYVEVYRRAPSALPAPWLLAWSGALAVPRSDFKSIEGFDEDYLGWGVEDVDLAARLCRRGLPIEWIFDRAAVYASHCRSGGRTEEHAENARRLHTKLGTRESELYAFLNDGFAANLFAAHLDGLDLEAMTPSTRPITLEAFGGSTIVAGLVPSQVPPASSVVLHHKETLASEMMAAAPGATHHRLLGLSVPYATRAFRTAIVGDLIRLLPAPIAVQCAAEMVRVAETVRLRLSSQDGHEAAYPKFAGWSWMSLAHLADTLATAGMRVERVECARREHAELRVSG
jgi:glycosyltransferase involved in cell wall biosynthesis